MIAISVSSTEYIDGRRVDIVEHTYNKSDDYIRLGQLYFTYGQKLAIKEQNGLVKGNAMSTDHLDVMREIENLESMISAQLLILKGYGD